MAFKIINGEWKILKSQKIKISISFISSKTMPAEF